MTAAEAIGTVLVAGMIAATIAQCRVALRGARWFDRYHRLRLERLARDDRAYHAALWDAACAEAGHRLYVRALWQEAARLTEREAA